jgi:hypothetical protein
MRHAILALATALLPAAALADGHTLQNSRLTLLFGSSTTGYTTKDADRVDAITWIDSAGTAVANYITQANPACSDPTEFFGQAYGNGGSSRPYAVIGGVIGKWSGKGASSGKTSIKNPTACSSQLDALTTTSYTLSNKAALADTLEIARTLKFTGAAATGDMRAYVVRTPLQNYPSTIYLDKSGALQTASAGNCGGNCVITDWNGKWMAQDSGTGTGIAIFRKPNAKYPAEITVDSDGASSSNASAITLIQPAKGWAGLKVTETEYLCFYDATSWTASAQKAGKPPVGCTGVPH